MYVNSTVNIGLPTPHSTSMQGFRCVTVKQCFFAPFLRVFALRGGLSPSFNPCLSPGIFPFSSPPANDWSRRGYFDVFITSLLHPDPWTYGINLPVELPGPNSSSIKGLCSCECRSLDKRHAKNDELRRCVDTDTLYASYGRPASNPSTQVDCAAPNK